MNKSQLSKPLLILVYGFPGAGKTHFARELAASFGLAHVQPNKIRAELFKKPRFDAREGQVVNQLANYLSSEFLTASLGVVFDGDSARISQRKQLRELAKQAKAATLTVWLQIDLESAFSRAHKRDHRKIDDRYDLPMDRTTFDSYVNSMQNPGNEDYVVISGKHTFATQRSAIMKKFFDMGLISTNTVASTNTVKPELINLIPALRGRQTDSARRNIFIR